MPSKSEKLDDWLQRLDNLSSQEELVQVCKVRSGCDLIFYELKLKEMRVAYLILLISEYLPELRCK